MMKLIIEGKDGWDIVEQARSLVAARLEAVRPKERNVVPDYPKPVEPEPEPEDDLPLPSEMPSTPDRPYTSTPAETLPPGPVQTLLPKRRSRAKRPTDDEMMPPMPQAVAPASAPPASANAAAQPSPASSNPVPVEKWEEEVEGNYPPREDVMVALQDLTAEKGVPVSKALLKKFYAAKFSDLQPKYYSSFIALAKVELEKEEIND